MGYLSGAYIRLFASFYERTHMMPRMDCEECEPAQAQLVRVEFGSDKSETLALCECCLHDFQDADLVKEISPLDGENIAQ